MIALLLALGGAVVAGCWGDDDKGRGSNGGGSISVAIVDNPQMQDLTRGGLRSGLDSVVARLDVPVQVDVPAERLPPEIEASAYFIVAEALTNVVKHSRAGRAEVRAYVRDGMLHVEVRDDGTGGADPHGHGLVGTADRVAALGGRLTIDSPAGGGTLVAATLPLSAG